MIRIIQNNLIIKIKLKLSIRKLLSCEAQFLEVIEKNILSYEINYQ